jgi:uncharacterized protein YkwD
MAAALLGLLGLRATGAATFATATTTPQGALSTARTLRLRGCDGHSGIRAPLRSNAALNAAAAQWSRGGKLKAAIERSGYREDQSAGLHLSGTAQALSDALALHLCAALTDQTLIDAGTYERGSDTWIILAAPFAAPSADAGDTVANDMLRLVNAARAEPQHCGRSIMAAAAPLRLNALLSRAALTHAQDMLRYSYFEHAGHDGSSPALRIAATGYRYRIVGENIALGPETPQEAVRGWMSSPGHCQNIMDARFAEMGVAYTASRSGEPRIYWVQEFAAAR